jgi:SnoaL-like domain
MDAGALVGGLYRAYQDRNWDRAATFLHPDAVVEMPATAERLDGLAAIVAFQRSYPEPWGVLSVKRVLVDDEGAAAEVSVADPSGTTFAFAAFWRTEAGLLRHGVEYWLEIGADVPPPNRASTPATQAARKAWKGARRLT